MSKFDDWLTNEPDYLFAPIYHDIDSVKDAEDEFFNSENPHGDDKYESVNSVYLLSNDNVDALNCKICNDYLGWILDDNNDYRPTLNFTEFYQIDEDGEHLLCVPCYEEVTKEDLDEE